ncbi:MAG TPA: DUF488 domain-containing protein [Ignavibacteria bacterium]
MENKEKKTIVCQYCGEQFYPIRTSRKFCSDKCKQAAYRTRLEKKESCKLYTIGTDGRQLPDFIEILKENGIKNVLDIRNLAADAIFNKDYLKYFLGNEGITYTHDRKLYPPSNNVNLYYENKISTSDFESLYKENISQLDINKLAKKLKARGKTVLLGSIKEPIGHERRGIKNIRSPNQPSVFSQVDYKFKVDCHRSILANILKETGEFDEIIHL